MLSVDILRVALLIVVMLSIIMLSVLTLLCQNGKGSAQVGSSPLANIRQG
jgi:hypothetical protein